MLLIVSLGKVSSNNRKPSSFLRNSIVSWMATSSFAFQGAPSPGPDEARSSAVQAPFPRALPFDLAASCPCSGSRVTRYFVVNPSTKYFRRLISASRRPLGLVLLRFFFAARGTLCAQCKTPGQIANFTFRRNVAAFKCQRLDTASPTAFITQLINLVPFLLSLPPLVV